MTALNHKRPGREGLAETAVRGRTRFLILGRYRSGSTLVARTLRQHPALVVHEELFNINHLARRRSIVDPSSLIRQVFAARHSPEIAAIGFKLMYCQATRAELEPGYWHPGPSPSIAAAIASMEARIKDNRLGYLRLLEATWSELALDTDLRIIHLDRGDKLAAYVSYVLAMSQHRWIDIAYDSVRIHVDPGHLRQWCESGEVLTKHYSGLFASHPTLRVTYEDLTARFASVMGAIVRFLGVEGRPLAPGTVRQMTRPLKDVVDNYDEVAHIAPGHRVLDPT